MQPKPRRFVFICTDRDETSTWGSGLYAFNPMTLREAVRDLETDDGAPGWMIGEIVPRPEYGVTDKDGKVVKPKKVKP